MHKTLAKLFAASAVFVGASAGAVTYEDWSAAQVSAAGIVYNDGTTQISDGSKRWAINNWKASCLANPAGPNTCYASGNGQFGFHAENGTENGINGGGILFASTYPISFTNGITIEAQVNPNCWQRNGDPVTTSCGINIGLWESEANYRSIGFKSYPSGNSLYLNIWGPSAEANFNGTAPYYQSMPMTAYSTYTLKVRYVNTAPLGRWDYFVNGNWVAGHDGGANDQYHMGNGSFPSNQVRLQFAAFSNNFRPSTLSASEPYNAAEGWFGPITYTTF